MRNSRSSCGLFADLISDRSPEHNDFMLLSKQANEIYKGGSSGKSDYFMLLTPVAIGFTASL